MHRSDPGRVRGEVSTGAAGESAGRPPAVSGREGSSTDLVPVELVERWEKVYREYVVMDRAERRAPDYPVRMRRLSAAAAWRDLSATPGLPWWLVASLTTSAEAFDDQARWWHRRAQASSERPSDRPSERGSGPGPLHPGQEWYRSLGPDGPAAGGGR